jgi:hypothetical protein
MQKKNCTKIFVFYIYTYGQNILLKNNLESKTKKINKANAPHYFKLLVNI